MKSLKISIESKLELNKLKEVYQECNKSIDITDELMTEICIHLVYESEILHKDRLNSII